MITYPDAFHAELDKQIRRRGYCQVIIYLSGNDSISIDDGCLKSVEMTLRADPMCRELPIEECEFSLLDFSNVWNPDNPSGMYADAEKGDKITLRFGIDTASGTVSWGPWITFFLKSSPEWRDGVATFAGTRQLGRLTNEFYKLQTTETLGSIATTAVEDGLAYVGYAGADMEYDISSDLFNVPVIHNTTLKNYTVADTLMAVAFAGKKNLRTKFGGNDGIVEVKDCVTDNPQKTSILVPRRDMFSLPVSDRLPPIRNEIVTHYKEPSEYTQEETVLQYSGSEVSGSDPVFLPTDQPILPGLFAVRNATNVSGGIFARGQYRNGIVMWGITKADPSLPITFDGIARPMVITPATTTIQINANGTEDERIDNPLLTESISRDVAVYRSDYFANTKSKFLIDFRGHPAIEPLDLIRVELPYAGFATCIVLENKFKYSGGFSGSLIVRKLETIAQNQEIASAISGCAVSDEAISDRSV